MLQTARAQTRRPHTRTRARAHTHTNACTYACVHTLMIPTSCGYRNATERASHRRLPFRHAVLQTAPPQLVDRKRSLSQARYCQDNFHGHISILLRTLKAYLKVCLGLRPFNGALPRRLLISKESSCASSSFVGMMPRQAMLFLLIRFQFVSTLFQSSYSHTVLATSNSLEKHAMVHSCMCVFHFFLVVVHNQLFISFLEESYDVLLRIQARSQVTHRQHCMFFLLTVSKLSVSHTRSSFCEQLLITCLCVHD
jgi:hypothetical protein